MTATTFAAAAFALLCMMLDAYVTHWGMRAGRRQPHPRLRWVLGDKPSLLAAMAWRFLVWSVLALWVPMPWWGWLCFASLFVFVAIRNWRL